jgi:hypothetical protein
MERRLDSNRQIRPRIYTQYVMAILGLILLIQAVTNYNYTVRYGRSNTTDAGWQLLLASVFVVSCICSLIFWSDNKYGVSTKSNRRRSEIHYADATIARICFVLFTYFFMCVKRGIGSTDRVVFTLVLLVCVYAIYRSDRESAKQYRGLRHIYFHQVFHVFASIGVTMAFCR